MTPQAPFGTAPGFQVMSQQHNLFMQQPNRESSFSVISKPLFVKLSATFINNGTNPFLQSQPSIPSVNFVQQNGAPTLVPTVSPQHFTPEQLAAAFAQQQIAQQQATQMPAPTPFDAPPPAASTSISSTSGVLAPPPPPSHPVPRRVSGSGSGWPEENKENGTNSNGAILNGSATAEDPVWVLRDSYLKKMQREQRTSAEEVGL